MAQLAFEGRHGLPELVYGATVGPQGEVVRAQEAVRMGLIEDIPAGRAQDALAIRNGVIIGAHAPAVVAYRVAELPEPPLITQGLRQRFGLTEGVKAPVHRFSERPERIGKGETEVDGLGERVALLGEMLRGDQCLLKGRHRLPERRARHGLAPCLPVIQQRLVPDLAPEGMVGQAVNMVGQAVACERLKGLDDPRVQHPPPLWEQTAVRHLVGQRVLEGVGVFRDEVGLVEELGRLEVSEAVVHGCLRHLGNRLQQRYGHLQADDRGCLQQALLGRWQAVDPCRQHRLHGRRHLHGWQGLRQVIGPTRADQHPGLHQSAHAFFQEEGIALRARDEELEERRQGRVVPEEPVQQFLGTRGGERVEPELGVGRLTAPVMVVFGTVVDEEHEAGRRQAVDQAVQERLRLGVDPVQVLHDQEQGLDLARLQQQARADLQGALAALRRLEGLPVRVFNWYV